MPTALASNELEITKICKVNIQSDFICVDKWPVAPFLGFLHPVGAQNISLISNTVGSELLYPSAQVYLGKDIPYLQQYNYTRIDNITY